MRNLLGVPETVAALKRQMTVDVMQSDGVHERWYSECDGRIQALVTSERTLVLRAFSWEGMHEVGSVDEAADLLVEKYREYRARFTYDH